MSAELGEVFINRVRNRLHKQNKNWLAIICGQTGSGKSYSAVSIAQQITREDNKYYIVFKPEEFMSLLTGGKLRRGDVIVFDEAGVGMSSREWYSAQNKLLGAVLQTFRILNIGVIFTTPVISFIDIQARQLFHNYLLTENIDAKARQAYLKVYDIKNDAFKGTLYYTHPVFFSPERGFIKLNKLCVEYPSNDGGIIDKYEQDKQAYTKEINSRPFDGAPIFKKTETESFEPINLVFKGKRDLKAYEEN